MELRDTPYEGTLWLRYNNELVANKSIPPKMVKKHLKDCNIDMQCSTAQHSTAQHSTAQQQHSTAAVQEMRTIYRFQHSPIGLGIGKTCEQSKGRCSTDQMTGLTSSVKFNEIATKAQVSWRTASRLENIVTALDWEQFGFSTDYIVWLQSLRKTFSKLRSRLWVCSIIETCGYWLGHSIDLSPYEWNFDLHRYAWTKISSQFERASQN